METGKTGIGWTRILAIALGYILVARLSLFFVVKPENVASFWPSSGYMLAALLLTRGREWRWLLLALFVANAGANLLGGNPPLASVGFAFANCLESLAAAWLMAAWLGRPLTMSRLGEVIGFVGFGPLFSNMLTALVGASVAAIAFGAPFWSAWRVWWISDSMGMLLVTPVVLSWADANRPALRTISRQRLVEGALLFGGMVLSAWFVFASRGTHVFLPLPYATFPFVLWAAVRFGPRGGTLATVLLAVVAVWHTSRGAGPFGATEQTQLFQVLSVQAFLSVAALCSLMLGALIDERRQAEEALRSAYSSLEVRIGDRTRELSSANQALQSEVVERARAEQEVRRAVAELARSNAELEAYAYVASHDLQEPLRAVAGTVQLLQTRYQGRLDEGADELIAHAVSGISRMKALISDLLAYSRIDSRRSPKPTDCDAVMKEVLTNLAATIEDCDAQVKHGEMPTVVVDPTQMTQLFQNLIGNAVKFRGERRPEIQVQAQRQGAEVKFTVRDNGIGIESQYYDRIFGVFQRLHTRKAYPGTGIGLAICKKIVERHGGRIWVESEPGRGTAFFFTLPAPS